MLSFLMDFFTLHFATFKLSKCLGEWKCVGNYRITNLKTNNLKMANEKNKTKKSNNKKRRVFS